MATPPGAFSSGYQYPGSLPRRDPVPSAISKDGLLSSAVGTSFSTPRIASLAAGLYQELNEEFDSLLLKALIVHFASYSKELNASHEATLILRDSLAKGEFIDIMDFPMPSCLVNNGFFTGQVIATLVYDPILDCQSNVDVKFGSYDAKAERDVSKCNILNPVGRQGAQNLLRGNLYSKQRMKEKADDFALRERLLIQYEDKYYPVKKYAVDSVELSQDICLILTIRDSSDVHPM